MPAKKTTNAYPVKVDDDDEYEIVVLPPLPPDGGYGWVVMISAMLCSVIVDGVCFSFGVFFNEFVNTFESTNAKTSWVGSLVPGMYLGMGEYCTLLGKPRSDFTHCF
jgi:hypothetical protein